jgi:diacylglycerol kinase (ATP)
MRAVLIYNPVAGTDRSLRRQQIQQICELLERNGHSATAIATTAPGSAADQACTAITAGCDCLFACGGDGTVHDVLQGIVAAASAGGPPAILGVIPMGSANALARHLGLSMSPIEAARQQLTFTPRLISVGLIECGEHRRPFTVMAGAGADGVLVHRLVHGTKQRFGRLAYYFHAARLFLTHRFSPFDLEFVDATSGTRHTLRAVSAMALRIDDLGGLFSRIAGGGHVHHPHLQLVVVRPPAWLSLPLWFIAGWFGVGRWNPFLRTASVNEFTCTPSTGSHVHVQADGEWLGTAPIHVTLLHDAVRLLMPPVQAISSSPYSPSPAPKS